MTDSPGLLHSYNIVSGFAVPVIENFRIADGNTFAKQPKTAQGTAPPAALDGADTS